MSRNNKERHRAKRQQKRVAQQRSQAGVYHRIGETGEPLACYITAGWREAGIASIHVLRRAPGGAYAMGAFLIDFWCIGLKDAFGRLNISLEEFQSAIDQTAERTELTRVDISTIRRLLSGAVRFSQQNNFRLPHHHERWLALVGRIGDVSTADLSDFGAPDGKLRYFGDEADLRRRLINCSVADFIKRDDVEVVFGHGMEEFEKDIEEEATFQQNLDETQTRLANAIRKWCFQTGRVPHPELARAVEVIVSSTLEVAAKEDPPEGAEDELADQSRAVDRVAEMLLSLHEPDQSLQIRQAMEQVRAFMSQFSSTEAMIKAIHES